MLEKTEEDRVKGHMGRNWAQWQLRTLGPPMTARAGPTGGRLDVETAPMLPSTIVEINIEICDDHRSE